MVLLRAGAASEFFGARTRKLDYTGRILSDGSDGARYFTPRER
jgi:hypothetical protein